MKQKKWLMYPFACLLSFLLFVACPAPAPEDYIFTLDKYEVRAGDEITVDTDDVRVFRTDDFSLYYYTKDSEGFRSRTKKLEIVKKIDSSRAVFKIPTDIVDGELKLEGAIEASEVNENCDDSCASGKFYGVGYSDKPLIVKE